MPVLHQNIIMKNKNLYCAKGSSSILEVIDMLERSILSCLLVHIYSCKNVLTARKQNYWTRQDIMTDKYET